VTLLEPAGWDVVGVRAANPSPLTLSGTNTWIVGRDPTWLIDPGPALPEHLVALDDEIARRGGLGGIALTHDHADHGEAVPALRERHPHAPLAAARGAADVRLSDGATFGPFAAVATPGHAPDHMSFLLDRVAFTGDSVLGEGSVFISPYPGAMSAYLKGLARLRERPLELICPGHGPLVIEPAARLDQYIEHRLDRERRLVEALGQGKRTVAELLDDVWDDAPTALRPVAALTLAAHLDKLEQEGRLPAGVERPSLDGWPVGV
jgi:glyoxylase-like metal-dependent hydrolase (beta-lactamase superfamily II)